MIPYYELRTLSVGGLELAVFGLLVATGVAVGALFAQHRARVLGVPEREMNAVFAWALIPGFFLAHAVVLVFDRPPGLEPSLWQWLEFWNGMSSFGGFLGATLGLLVYFAIRPRPWLAIADLSIQALVVGWIFGRLGCALVHDHVGRLTDFPLAVRFPDGPRHELGLYEFAYTLGVLLPAVLVLNRKPRVPGTSLVVLTLLYAPARFAADFLRHTDLPGPDPRYLGFTAAQYGCLVSIAIALYLVRRLRGASA